MARHQLDKMRLTLLAGIAVAVGPRVAGVWATYLAGGSPIQDFTGKFGDDFAQSPTTENTTGFLVQSLKAKLIANPPTIPIPYISTDIDISTLIPAALTEINTPNATHEMNFSIPRDIPGNLAGGIGQDQTTCKAGAMPSPINDQRKATGVVTVSNDPITGALTATPQIEYMVQDTVDLCPGDCGSSLEQNATVVMSQFEATGIAGDVPFTVKFPAKTPRFSI